MKLTYEAIKELDEESLFKAYKKYGVIDNTFKQEVYIRALKDELSCVEDLLVMTKLSVDISDRYPFAKPDKSSVAMQLEIVENLKIELHARIRRNEKALKSLITRRTNEQYYEKHGITLQ